MCLKEVMPTMLIDKYFNIRLFFGAFYSFKEGLRARVDKQFHEIDR